MRAHARHHLQLVLAQGATNATFVLLRDRSEGLVLLGSHLGIGTRRFVRRSALIAGTRCRRLILACGLIGRRRSICTAAAVNEMLGDVFPQFLGRFEEYLTQFAPEAILFQIIVRLFFRRLHFRLGIVVIRIDCRDGSMTLLLIRTIARRIRTVILKLAAVIAIFGIIIRVSAHE